VYLNPAHTHTHTHTHTQAEGCANKAEYDKKFGADLWQIDVEQYDKVCVVREHIL